MVPNKNNNVKVKNDHHKLSARTKLVKCFWYDKKKIIKWQ